MGYDFLGTMTASEWSALSSFFKASKDIMIQMPEGSTAVTPIDLTKSTFMRRIEFERHKAFFEKELFQECVQHFAFFQGDKAIQSHTISDPNAEIRPRLKLSDAETAYYVQKLRDPMRLMFKRKKDNLEYRIKKAYDMSRQFDEKYMFYKNYKVLLEGLTPDSTNKDTAGAGQKYLWTDNDKNYQNQFQNLIALIDLVKQDAVKDGDGNVSNQPEGLTPQSQTA